MIEHRKVFLNASTTVFQVALSGVIFFILYRYLLRTIGVQKLGIWSVVLATTLATAIGDFGFSGGVVKFVAKYRARNDIEAAAAVVQTAALSIAVLLAALLFIAYPFFRFVLKAVLPHDALVDAFMLLPYAVAALWINSVGGVFQASLDGLQRNAIRSVVTLGGGVLLLLMARLLVPTRGLQGLALAQISQGGFVACASWLLLKTELRQLPVVPFRWNAERFREMARYGAGFQLATLATMLFDPVTKGLLAKYGGLASTGYYEMASRMVMQLRALLVNANQVLVPVIAGLHETTPHRVTALYKDSSRILFFFALPFYSGVIVIAPIISKLWLGRIQTDFIEYTVLLAVGWLANTIAGPAYFANLGTGNLRWNVLGQLAIGLLNAILGLALGVIAGGLGVVAGWAMSLSIGSLLILLAHARTYRLTADEVFPTESRRLATACLGAVSLTLAIYYLLLSLLGYAFTAVICTFVFLGFTAVFLWRDPVRPRLIRWAVREWKHAAKIEVIASA